MIYNGKHTLAEIFLTYRLTLISSQASNHRLKSKQIKNNIASSVEEIKLLRKNNNDYKLTSKNYNLKVKVVTSGGKKRYDYIGR